MVHSKFKINNNVSLLKLSPFVFPNANALCIVVYLRFPFYQMKYPKHPQFLLNSGEKKSQAGNLGTPE